MYAFIAYVFGNKKKKETTNLDNLASKRDPNKLLVII